MGAIEEYKARNAAREAGRAKKQEPPEKRFWWFNQPVPIDRFTGWLVAWTALLFVATIGNVIILKHTDDKIGAQAEIAAGQLTVMKGQLDIMKIQEADQRPWVSFTEPQILSDLIVTKNSATMTFSATLQNTGHVPAENVTPYIQSYIFGGNKGYPNVVRDTFCEGIAKNPLVRRPIGKLSLDGNILFPGDKLPFKQEIAFSPEDLTSARSSDAPGLPMWVIVCINYKIILQENDRHQTSHIFIIPTLGVNAANPLNEGGVVPKGELSVSFSQFGTHAN